MIIVHCGCSVNTLNLVDDRAHRALTAFVLALRIIRDHFGDDIYSSDDESTFEIPKGDFLDGIQKVKGIPEEEFDRRYPSLVKADYSKEEFIAALQDIYDSADPDNDEITMDWF